MGNMCDADTSPTNKCSSLEKIHFGPAFDESPTRSTTSPKRRKVNKEDFLNLGLVGKVLINDII